jgi:hypothetical protein
MTTVVTGWTTPLRPRSIKPRARRPDVPGYDELGHQFCQSFDEYWPASVELIAYVDTPRPLPRAGQRPITCLRGLDEFQRRHRENLAAHGRQPNRLWKARDREKGSSFRWDAVGFASQLFIPEHAAQSLPDGEILAWFDADVKTYRGKVPRHFIEDILGDADLCYLGRGDKHSEIGFWACRLNDRSRAFLASMPDLYRSDKIFELAETHSAYVFDHCRKLARGLRVKDLTPGGSGHVWFHRTSPVARYLDHLKGESRKRKGRSDERPR